MSLPTICIGEPNRQARAAGTSGPRVRGYAAVFYNPSDPKGTQYLLGEGVFERVNRHAFDRTLREDSPLALFGHDMNLVLGSVQARTLELGVDDHGLRYGIAAPNTTLVNDLLAPVRRGDIRGASFAFTVRDVGYEREGDGMIVREIMDVLLHEVSITGFPAYKSATVESDVRGIAQDRRMSSSYAQMTILRDMKLLRAKRDRLMVRMKDYLARQDSINLRAAEVTAPLIREAQRSIIACQMAALKTGTNLEVLNH